MASELVEQQYRFTFHVLGAGAEVETGGISVAHYSYHGKGTQNAKPDSWPRPARPLFKRAAVRLSQAATMI